MQQRLRGAQSVASQLPPHTVTNHISHIRRRQVKDVDFGLTFPAVPSSLDPAQHAITSQSTPQPVLPRELPTRENPASSGRGRRHGAITTESNPPTTRSSTNDANISAKRRKLNNDLAAPSSTRNTRSSPHAPRPDTSALLPEENEREQPAAEARNGSVEQEVEPDELEIVSHIPRQGIGQIPSFSAPTTEVVTESPENAPGSGHRLRVSLDEATLQSLQLQARLQDSSPRDSERIDSSPAERRKRKLGEATPRHLISSAKRSPHHQTSQDDDGELDELSPDQPRGRGRKPKQVVGEEPADVEADEEVAQVSAEEAEEINDDEAAVILKKNRGRGRSKNRAAKSPDLDEPSLQSSEMARKKREKARKISTPAQQRQPKVATQVDQKTVSKTSKNATKSSKVRAGSPIPITVHRFTKRPLYDDEDSDVDILNSEIPYIKRGGVNAIDVLRQVCHEIIDSGLDTLADGGRSCNDPALRREYKTKWSAVEAFGRELENRLLDHVTIYLHLIHFHCF
jgi:hypothetical protein